MAALRTRVLIVLALLALGSLQFLLPRIMAPPSSGDSAARGGGPDMQAKVEELEAELQKAERELSSLRTNLHDHSDEMTKLLRGLEDRLGASVAAAGALPVAVGQARRAIPPERIRAVPQGPGQQHNPAGVAADAVADAGVNPPPPPPRPPIDVKPLARGAVQEGAGCALATRTRGPSALDVDRLYGEEIEFKDPMGGAWTQGWDVQYNPAEWNSKPLNVFLMPHSHNDPGWLKTFEQYYQTATRNILTRMIAYLTANGDATFVWAEISFFEMWWREQSPAVKANVKKLIAQGRFEIVTGGWVMPDEANSHYYAVVEQLLTGHQWVERELGVKPRVGWSVDPFGHSPTMAYLLKRSGFSAMLIQRIHYEIKHVLARNKNLEFQWVQEWDRGQDTAMYTHMMPFYSYDVPHTCGPDPSICCQFDFARLPGMRFNCPWRKPPKETTPQNVAERARLLVDQYRKKAQLYKTHNILVPLGDDFRYSNDREIQAQFRNYRALFKYMNAQPEFKIHARFATLSDYFNAVYAELGAPQTKPPQAFPTLQGDFFTYADRKDNYWSGYYTSRPFYKHLDRVLESSLRAAETLYTIGRSKGAPSGDYGKLVSARRAMGLFQHHDGITGTAKDHVVVDYGNKLIAGINNAMDVIARVATALVTDNKPPAGFQLVPEATRRSHDSLPDRQVIAIAGDAMKPVVFHNPHGQTRRQAVSVLTNKADVKVTNSDGAIVPSQAHPGISSERTINTNVFEVWFEITVPPFGLATYYLSAPPQMVEIFNEPQHTLASVELIGLPVQPVAGFDVRAAPTAGFSIENGAFSLSFGPTGLLQSATDKQSGKNTQLNLEFHTYDARGGADRSGAYLFMPNGPSRVMTILNAGIRITKGPIVQEVVLHLANVVHVVRIFNSDAAYAAAIAIDNIVDVRSMNNKELVMKFKTNVDNTEYYTDLNGFMMRKRKTYSKVPLQGNFYPLPSMAFLEDAERRITLHTHSAVGCAGLDKGGLEVVLDRRLMQDDKRGVGQGVKDNKVTLLQFALTIEERAGGADSVSVQNPTLFAHLTNDLLNYPTLGLVGTTATSSLSAVEPMAGVLPCDVHVVALRTLAQTDQQASHELAVLLHRKGFVCGFGSPTLPCQAGGKVSLKALFPSLGIKTIKEKSLSLMHDMEGAATVAEQQALVPMELHSFLVSV